MRKRTVFQLRHFIAVIAGYLLLATLPFTTQAQFRYTTNTPVIKDTTISSRILGEDRKISIYRPEVFPEYAQAVPPVIYLLDGEAYIHYFASMINMLCERFVQLPPITVIAVQNYVSGSYSGRDRDFKTADGVAKFLRFVNEELIPNVEKNYQKKPYRMIVGHSSSADFAMKVFFIKPALFNAYLLSSPDLREGADIRLADSSLSHSQGRKNTVFMSTGIEGWAQESVQRLDSFLRQKVQNDLSYNIKHYPDESHFSVFLKSYYDGFGYIFNFDPAKNLKNPMDITIQAFRDHYKSMQPLFGFPIKPPQTITGEYAQNFLSNWKNLDKALDFFRENAENYPNDPSAQIDYADALLKKGDKKNATAQYEKALRLNPTDEKLKAIIDKMKKEQ